ncbi:hypothetical protein JJQ72_03590 [Paenibacillus sp. F411]|uniref:putative amidoligase domain-containing protein n=1 Tax=Paenibacillus sp. F411 TaxID=2820239 RepID=UPI001AAE2718|nr:hypothetical protein [Paenibacillus sp. F411]MBO2943063.1 hypothetical protein [Paenibacillus sp. F411]
MKLDEVEWKGSSGNVEQPLQMSLEDIHHRLERSGIPSRIKGPLEGDALSMPSRYAASYLVTVYSLEDAEVCKLMASNAGYLQTSMQGMEHSGSSDGLHARLCRAAIRTLYVLGLERGEVTISLLPGRRYVVEHIARRSHSGDGKPRQDSSLKPQGPGAPVLLGMDPEFILVDREGRVADASQFLDRYGRAGCDAVRIGETVTYPLAELRPEPKAEPESLLLEMRRVFRDAWSLITDRTLEWRAGAMPADGYPLGGHLHFSGIPLSLEVLQCLDNYLSLPLAALEDPRGRSRRPRYGSLGDFRHQSHGGFEYRTPPSFLVSPLITRGVLHMAYLIAHHYSELNLRPLSYNEVHRAYYEGDRSVLSAWAVRLHQDYGKLKAYEAHRQCIDRLFKQIYSGKTWNESRDIRRLWNLPVLP